MSGFNLSKYRDMFAEEASEQFETIENLLLEAENNGTLTDDEMNTLFRAMHTLKGGSASVELKLFAGFTHEVESFLDKLRNNEIKYNPEMVVVLIDCTDVLKEILTKELSDDIELEEVKEMTVSLLEQLSIFASEFSVNNIEVSQNDTQSIPLQEKKDEDAFGFFDEIEIVEDNTSDKLSHKQTETIEEDAFGFFDDETENNSFGFFKPDDKKKYSR